MKVDLVLFVLSEVLDQNRYCLKRVFYDVLIVGCFFGPFTLKAFDLLGSIKILEKEVNKFSPGIVTSSN
jgi:hypothetical protein